MANISSSINIDSNLINLAQINTLSVRQEVYGLLISGEEIDSAYQTIRDQVIFTNKRIIVINIQGITGKKVSYTTYPYSRVQSFSIQTAGMLDLDCELFLYFISGRSLQLDFRANVNMKKISQMLAERIL